MAEAIPTGTFGHSRPPKPHDEPWTPEEQAQHLATLAAALKDWHDPSEQAEADRQRHRPHLHLITTHTNAA
ncbi:hypothetical protein [Streptomyces sp. enrichment culture]|uniref:hypothetical protein n=1 Tax=Streptomyces sp. enrichment culture TaxID=1795815 RepID=UPI003F548636